MMIARIGVYNSGEDAREFVRKKKLVALNFGKGVSKIKIVDIFTIEKDFSLPQLKLISSILSNPVTQKYTINLSNKKNPKPDFRFDYAIEIGFLPGVTDNIASTARESIEDLLKIKFSSLEGVYTSQITFLSGNISPKEAVLISENMFNSLIQRIQIKNYREFIRDGGMDFTVPRVKLKNNTETVYVNLDISDDELGIIGKKGIANRDGTRRGPLALDLKFMKTIQKYFRKLGRSPTDIELESLAQTWSEHCKHTIFADPLDDIKEGLFRKYIKGTTEKIRKLSPARDMCVSVFEDNSGAITFDKNFLVTHKVETHNSPSALDPFGGAITGIVGVNRDTIGFGLGAKPVANYYGYCLTDPRIDIPLYKDKDLKQKMLGSRRIMEGVIEGVNAGGNQSGIPTPSGFIHFDERYRGKPLVFVGTVGLIPKKIKGKTSFKKKAKKGDYIVMVGGRVGKDGIHGATFSSEAMDTGSPVTAVQIGDPITQKKMSDALVKEARDKLLYDSITDNGAGGLSCSVAEMAKESGGCVVDLEKVPLKYPGLNPWEIWISESQERMTLAIPKGKWSAFRKLMERRGVEATVIGVFTVSGKCIVRYKNETIMDISMDFLHYGLPVRKMFSKKVHTEGKDILPQVKKNLTEEFLNLLKRPNIAGYSFISEQYDHIVQGNLALGPLQGDGQINGECSAIRPVLGSKKAVLMSYALYPSYSELDPYNMASSAIDTAVRNVIAAGANPDSIALLDNFCWCSGNDPVRLYQLKQAAKACYELGVYYRTPFISGKDSMFNDFKGFDRDGKPLNISIPPTLLITALSVIENVYKIVSPDSKKEGDIVYILGETKDELGGSEYLKMINTQSGKDYRSFIVPKVDYKTNLKLYKSFHRAIEDNIVSSSIALGRGGLAAAIAKKSMAGKLGMEINLVGLPGKIEDCIVALFSESQGRFLVTIAPGYREKFEKIMKNHKFSEIGRVNTSKKIIIRDIKGKDIIETETAKALEAYRSTFKDY